VDAVLQVLKDKSIPNKNRLQMRVNYPEVGNNFGIITHFLFEFCTFQAIFRLLMQVNPAYDTYRIGTLLEMVRSVALALAEEQGLRVRVCVQQPLGEARTSYILMR